MRIATMVLALFLAAAGMYGQSDRATLTGAIVDPTGAVVQNARIEARNTETGGFYIAASTSAGNYSLAEVPAGIYEVTVTSPGFRTVRRANVLVPTAQVVRIDFRLEIGPASESVLVTEGASPLKTETGEISLNVLGKTLNTLPVMSVGAGSGIRNPYALLNVLPGTFYSQDLAVRINGMPSNTQTLRVEGQDATNGMSLTQSVTQPSVEAIEEVSIRTSSYAPEYGQAGGGVLNVTMKSGTNDFHGSVYDYAKNEVLNAGLAYTNNGRGEHNRNRIRQHDYGFTLGGPVLLPKIYDGHDRTFFFVNFEQFLETQVFRTSVRTVPTPAMRTGDFSSPLIFTGRVAGTDQLGRTILENQIFDWRTDTINAAGLRVRNAFPNNTIPLAVLDPVALKLQAYMPLPTSAAVANNYIPVYPNRRRSAIPSVKLDQSMGSRAKLSAYWSRTHTYNDQADGLPYPVTSGRAQATVAHTARLSLDYTVTPTMLLHLAAGFLHTKVEDAVAEFDPVRELGFKGASANYPMSLQGIGHPTFGGYIGASTTARIGPASVNRLGNIKPNFTASLSSVRGNHTAKFGAELITDGYPNVSKSYASPWLNFRSDQTAPPTVEAQQTVTLGVGLPYASFLLGSVQSGTTNVPTSTRLGKKSLGLYAQDTWRITRRLTVDYGLRYDFQTYMRETNGYAANLGPRTPNPALDGRLGGTIFEGYGPGRCQCSFAKNYPLAFGPRLSAAYQVATRTVIRGGFGLTYTRTASNNQQSLGAASPTQFQTPRFGDAVFKLSDGISIPLTFPNFDPSQFPFRGQPAAGPSFYDQNAGRPGRVMQWNFGVQREVAKDLVVELSYVGNRGVWLQSGALVNDTALQVGELAKVGLDFSKPVDRTLLLASLNSPQAAQRGLSGKPYSLFPATGNVAAALSPYPQYTSVTRLWAPLGASWYNALQATANKRFSHGLQFDASFTWSRQMTLGAETEAVLFQPTTPQVNDVFNRAQNKYLSALDQPLMLVISGNYNTPRWNIHPLVSRVVRDWQIGTVLRYTSGFPMRSPGSNNATGALLRRGQTWGNRVLGQPLYLRDLNCHCFDPSQTQVLNPLAWTDAPAGEFATSAAYYADFRSQRKPMENINFGRNFAIREGRINLNIRAEFTNFMNRLVLGNPSTGSLSAQLSRAGGPGTALTGGYGVISTNGSASNPRTGTLVARLTF